MPLRLDAGTGDFEAGLTEALNAKRASEAEVERVVAEILAAVAIYGDAAVIDCTQRFDRFDLTVANMRVAEQEIETAVRSCDEDVLQALRTAAARIKVFHQRQLPANEDFTDEVGVRLGWRWRPVDAAGVYVPGGTAAYPTSVLMNAIPARVAGVERVAMVVPAPDGALNAHVLVAAHLAGVTEIFRIGGAQAVGALAYGTATVRPVDVIVGPGNAYVATAKRQVFGTVGIDMIAGPSEVLIVCDGTPDAAWIAADLLAQAEHDTAAQSILITDDAAFADRVMRAVDDQLKTLPRRDVAGASWENHGIIIVVPSLADAPAIVDRFAPEHLQLAVADPGPLLDTVRHAGAVFLGVLTPEAMGDYVAGPNHVLPTGRRARFSSGLGVLDFMKRSTIIGCNAGSLAAIGPAAVTLAEAEGLDAHARSVALRLNRARPTGVS